MLIRIVPHLSQALVEALDVAEEIQHEAQRTTALA
jgi:hypothetical protein